MFKHYICDKGCKGVSGVSGACQAKDCAGFGKLLEACDCENNKHKMNQKNFLYLISVIFGLIFILHLSRLVFEWEVIFNGWFTPFWLSWIGLIIAGVLSYKAFRIAKKFA